MPKLCLTLLCPAAVEEKLLDVLLEVAADGVFTNSPSASHGLAPTRLSSAEQVMGRSASVLLQVLLDEPALELLLALLRNQFRGTGLRYWAVPVALEGEIE